MSLIFKIRDRVTGEVKVSLEDRLTKLIGVVTTTKNVAGSITVPGNNETGDIWYILIPTVALFYVGYLIVTVDDVNNTISWPSNQESWVIRYGRF